MNHFFKYFIFFLTFSAIQSQTNAIFCDQLSAVKEVVISTHYQPKPIDDDFSIGVYKLFLQKLDNRQQLLIQEDINSFRRDSSLIDNYVRDGQCGFITKYTKALENRISQTKTILESLTDVPLDYTGKDTLYFDADRAIQYFKDENHQANYWNKRIRYEILSSLFEEDSIIDTVKINFKVLEKELKPKIIQQQICVLDELLNQNGGIDRFVKESFLNAYLNYQDPNSSFFNATEKTRFENSVSNSEMSFGIYTAKNKDGDIVIAYIKPGSPVFMDGSFEVDDIIKSLTSNSAVLETFCVSNNDVIAFLNNEDHQTVNFKIKKKNGTSKSIRLKKIKSEVATNTITGYIIKNKQAAIGYIKIPGFYTDLESPNGLGVANDVAKELYKLQKESVEGLIIDLRFNSGGSMKEAADLSGMFINRGPLAIQKYNTGTTFTLKDANRGSLFNKPLVILINGYSASASEFFAAAMQDYNRGLILGSPSYGKASAQIIIPLKETGNLGFVKLTIEKFYRATGKSHQQKGIEPDIILPSVYDNFDSGEKDMTYALQNDSIEPFLIPESLKPLPLSVLSDKSISRRKNNLTFSGIKTLNQTLLDKFIHKKVEYPLTLDNVFLDFNDFKTTWNIFKTLNLEEGVMFVDNSASTTDIISFNEEEKSKNVNTLKLLSTDIYINEAQHVLIDIINLTNTH